MSNLNKIKLLILDIDGVLTDGTKIYNEKHEVISKRFLCKDFTAIKRMVASGIKVIMLSGDNFNKTMAEKRNIDFYCTRDKNLSLDKSLFIEEFQQKYNVSIDKMSFIGDDYFDLSMFRKIKYTFCPSDSPKVIKDTSLYVLNSKGGEGVIVELYDFLESNGYIIESDEQTVIDLDSKEITSKEMK